MMTLKPMMERRSDYGQAMHLSVTDLPTEIICHIFDNLFTPVSDDENKSEQWWIQDFHPLRLGSICSAWRDIAWDTPTLWTTLAVRNYDPKLDRKNRDQINLLKQWLDRTKGLKLNIYLGSIATRDKDFSPTPFMLLLLECCEQWLRLVFDPVHEWKSLFKLQQIDTRKKMKKLRPLNLPNLQSASFLNSRKASTPDFNNAPRLHRIQLENVTRDFDLLEKVVHWNRITHLTVKGSMDATVAKIFSTLPHLQKLHLISIHHQRQNFSWVPWTIVEHKHLFDLKVESKTWQWHSPTNLIPMLSLPALAVLDFHVGYSRQVDLMAFFQRSNFNLTSLTMYLPSKIVTEEVVEVLGILPKLTIIDLSGAMNRRWTTPAESLKTSIFELFDVDNSHNFLPNLVSFSFTGVLSDHGEGIEFLEPLISRSRTRDSLPTSSITLRKRSSFTSYCATRLTNIKIKDDQIHHEEFSISKHQNIEFRLEVEELVKAGILALLNFDHSSWC